MTAKKILKRSAKILLYLIGFVLILVIAVLIFINTNYGKRIIKDKAVAYLSEKLKTKVVIGSLDFSLPKWIELNGVYIEDQHKDTLLYGEKLAIDINMLKLINGGIHIKKVALKNMYANIYRQANDTAFNFQFIIDAFASKKTTPAPKDTSALDITLNNLLLQKVRVDFKDHYGGTNFSALVTTLDASLNKFQPDRLQFGVDKFNTDSVSFIMTTVKGTEIQKTVKVDTVQSTNDLFITANQFHIRNLKVVVDNKVNGMYYSNDVRQLLLSNADFSLAQEKTAAEKLQLDSSFIQFISPKADMATTTPDTTTASSNWNIALGELQMKNNRFQFDNNAVAPKEGLDIAHLDMDKINISAKKILYAADSTVATIDQISFKDKSNFTLDTTHANVVYTTKGISATELYIKTPQSIVQNTLQIKYDDIKQLTTTPQNSFITVKLNNTVIAVNDLYLLMPSIKKQLPPEKFQNNTVKLNTEINGNLQQLNIPYLQLKGLSSTTVNAKATLYNVTDTNNLGYDILVFNSSIPRSDIVKFLPENKNSATNKIPAVLNLNTHLTGNLKNTNAAIDISSNNFSLKGKGNIQNLKTPATLKYDVTILQSKVEKQFLFSLIPKDKLPQSIELPALILLTGTAKGDMNNIRTDMKLDGSYGVVTVKGNVNNFKNKNNANYDLVLTSKNFELGKLMKQDTVIGNVTLSATTKGTGFGYKTMNTVITSKIASVGFKKYNYQNIELNATLNDGNIKSNGNINDSSAKMQFDITANVKGDYPSAVDGTILIDTLQLKKLNLYKDSFDIAGKIIVKAPELNPDQLNAYLAMDSMKVMLKNKNYFFDSIITRANTENNVNTISFTSPLADINAKGKFEYDKIGQSIIQYIDAHYNITDKPAENLPAQEIAIDGEIKKHPLISDLITGLVYDNIKFKGSYASQGGDSSLNFTADVPNLQYKTNKLIKGMINISSANNSISGNIDFNKLETGSNILYATKVRASIANDSIDIAATTKDEKNKDRYILGATATEKDRAYTLHIKDTLLLNYQKWNVASNNKLTYSPEGVLAENFVLSNAAQKISIVSTNNTLNAPVDVVIENFDIKDITSILNSDTLLAAGLVNAKFTISDFEKKLPAFTGNMELSKFFLMQQAVGTVKLSADKKDDNTITATMDLTDNGNNMTVKGNYYLNNDDKQFDANIDIRRLNMLTVQAFSKGNLTRSSGSINGKIDINGKFTDPRWNGSLGFDTTKFTLTKLGTTYTLDQQKIALAYPNLSFSNFTIKDTTNHTLVLDGNIKSNSLSDFDLALKLKANDFIMVNSPKAINSQIYGFAAVNADININGNSSAPGIEGNISLDDKSDVTLVLPEQNINKDAALNVVRFIDRDTFALPEKVPFAPAVVQQSSFAQFLNYNLNLEVSKKAALTIIVDPSTGDALKVQGDAQLNAGVNPGGNIILAGNYELNSGYYILNYNFLKRQFNLLPGSTIAFSGTPMDAQINISAEYIVNTASKDLIGSEVGESDPKMSNTFNQKIPFRVILYLKGAMKKPTISFDIQLPDENTAIDNQLRTTIENKLSQLRGDEAATNKQVFSLLLLNRFAGEQSSDFFKGNGGSFNDLARESVSKFLSSALDQIASDLFKGVDIDLNLNSYQDYSSGDEAQKTDLNVAVSKSFLDDRLSVSVGKNFGIEGQDAGAKSQQRSNSIIPDVTVNYKLTKDGKYMIRAYKKDQFEVILDGYVVETGVAFILTLDYDEFKELFRKRSK